MASTTSLLTRLSTIFSSRPRLSPAALHGSAATSEAPRRFKRLSLRVVLLLILAVALSPVLVIGGVQWWSNIDREMARRRQTMALVAEEAASRAENLLSTAPALLDLIDAMVGKNDPCARDLADLIDRFPQFSTLGVIDAEGRAMCSSLVGGKGSSVANREWFHQLRDTGAPFIQSTAYFGPLTQQWILASAKRREDASRAFVGAYVIGVPVNALAYSLDRSGLPADSEIALVDVSGRVFSSEHWKTELPQSVLRNVNHEKGGFFETRADSGEVRQLAIVPLSPGSLYAMLSAPRLQPFAIENLSAFGNFALPLLAWFLALVTAWLATDRLVLRWLDYLRRVASLYASGKMTVQPVRARDAAPAEITSLAETLEDMAAKVRDRTTGLETALKARDAAMKEIHHRVKNNLQIINSLLSLQSRKVGDPSAVSALNDARSRINALSLIHRSLYEHNDIRTVSVGPFFRELATHLDQALGAEELGIRIEAHVDEEEIDADLAVPMALFTVEAVTTSIKHAFPVGKPGRVLISYHRLPEETVLSIEDDGAGSPQVDGGGLGPTLMSAFARQARGIIENETLANGGHAVRIRVRKGGEGETAAS